MNDLSMPLVALYGSVRGTDKIAFLGRKEEIELNVHDNLASLLRILELCNGRNSLRYIQGQLTDIDNKTFMHLIEILSSNGIIQDSRELYLMFHQDSANPLTFPRKISPTEVRNLVESRPEICRSDKCYELPRSHTALERIAESRYSTREFLATPVSLEKVAGLLRAMYGLAEPRPTPSAGQLYSLDIYLAIRTGDKSVDAGLYRYDPVNATLNSIVGLITNDKIARILNSEQFNETPLVVFVAVDLRRTAQKYANRGYRYSLIEAGHAAQNACLYCAETNLGILEYGGFQDEPAAEFLGLLYPHQVVLLTLLVGNKDLEADPKPDQTTLAYNLHQELVGEGKPIEWVVTQEKRDGQYRIPQIGSGAKYRAPSKYTMKMVSDRDCFGFGMSPSSDTAMIKAMVESYERYVSGLLNISVTACASQLQDEWLDPRVITPMNLLALERFNLGSFDPEVQLQWAIGKRYSSGNQVLVPVDHVFYPLHPQQLGRKLCYVSSSSGVAAHTNYNQAVERAMLELVERDAICTAWYAKRPVTNIPLESVSIDTRIRVEHWLERQYNVNFVNLTLDSVPVVLAMIHSHCQYPSLVSGAAAASSFVEAAAKAWDEAETLLMSWRRRRIKRRRLPEDTYSPLDHGKLYFQRENLPRVSWLLDAPTQHPASQQRKDPLKDFDPVVIDLTPTNIDCSIKIVRLISERLLPINFGYGNEHYGHRRFRDLGLDWKQEIPSFPHFFA